MTALRTTVQRAAVNAFASYLATALGNDVVVSSEWPEPDAALPAKAVTVLMVGTPTDDDYDPVPGDRVDGDGVQATWKWSMAARTQPVQLDVWTTSTAARDDLMARLDDALAAGPTLSANEAPVSPTTLVALGDGWSGFADFAFDGGPRIDDTPDSVQQREFRATWKGEAVVTLYVTATSAKLARASLALQLATADAASTPTVTTTVTSAATTLGHP